MSKSEVLQDIVKTRRSVRKFTTEEVKAEDLRLMIEAAAYAPSGANQQNWHYYVLSDRELIDRIYGAVCDKVSRFQESITSKRGQSEFSGYLGYFAFFKEAPIVIIPVLKPYKSLLSVIYQRYKDKLKDMGVLEDFNSETSVCNIAASIENLLLCAHSLGYGSCWMTGPMIAYREIQEILKLDPAHRPVAIIPVGRPGHESKLPHKKAAHEISTFI